MMSKVWYIVAVAAFWQYQICSAAIPVQQVPPEGYLLLVDYSRLSESCANETLQLTRDTYSLLPKYPGAKLLECFEQNRTAGTCVIRFADQPPGLQNNCINAGGQFDLNQTSDDFYRCIRNKNGEFHTTDVSIVNYPMCYGISCTEDEMKLAFDETISADADHGPLKGEIETSCSINPFGNSASTNHNRFNVGHIIRYTTMTMLVTYSAMYTL